MTEVGKVADASSGVATYPVTVAFDADPTQFFVGGSVQAAIAVQEVTDAVQVPFQAVTTTNSGSTVQVSTNGTTDSTTTRTVTTGLTSGGMVQITSGLTAGEQVVVTRGGFPGGGPGGQSGPSGGQNGGQNGGQGGGQSGVPQVVQGGGQVGPGAGGPP